MLNKPHIRDGLEIWNRILGETCGDFRTCINPLTPVFIGDIDHQKTDHLEMARIRTNLRQIIHRPREYRDHQYNSIPSLSPTFIDKFIRWQWQSSPWHLRSIHAPACMPESINTR